MTFKRPKIAMTNFLGDTEELKGFSLDHGFDGIDWSFDLDRLPGTPSEESRWVKDQSALNDAEIRYHCPFYKIDLGHDDPDHAAKALDIFRKIIRLVSKAGGRFLTVHIGLGHDSTEPLSWSQSIDNLRRLVQFGHDQRVRVCLENLAWGWTSRPNLFEKFIRKSGAGVTLDIGHAHRSEAVRSQSYDLEDFVSPHAGKVFNAHIYHTEVPGVGHIPPEKAEDIQDRLDLLRSVGCQWWAVEVKDQEGLLKTKAVLHQYLEKR